MHINSVLKVSSAQSELDIEIFCGGDSLVASTAGTVILVSGVDAGCRNIALVESCAGIAGRALRWDVALEEGGFGCRHGGKCEESEEGDGLRYRHGGIGMLELGKEVQKSQKYAMRMLLWRFDGGSPLQRLSAALLYHWIPKGAHLHRLVIPIQATILITYGPCLTRNESLGMISERGTWK